MNVFSRLPGSILSAETVAAMAAAEGYIPEADVRRLLAFRDDPADERWIRA